MPMSFPHRYIESYRVGRFNIDFFDISSRPFLFLMVDFIFLTDTARNKKINYDTINRPSICWLITRQGQCL